MKTISKDQVEKYIIEHARPVDIALYNYHFRNGDAGAVMQELAKFQNKDGGFGYAVEPDMRLPKSTALATWMAFQFIKKIDVDPNDKVIRSALDYLVETYDNERNGWSIVRPEVDDFPHAPWWEYKTAMEHFSWANPSAEILGLLIRFSDQIEAEDIITSLKEKAINQIQNVDPGDFHDVFNYKALYELADEGLKKELKQPVADLIWKASSTNPNEWKDYVATPLKFVDSPDDPFIELFDGGLIQQNLDFLVDQIVSGDHWEPNWDWSGNYPDEWEKAKVEWSGHLTVKNMVTLKKFGVIE